MTSLFLSVLLLMGFAAHAQAANMASHKAVYDLSLVSSHSGSPITNISGQLEYAITDVCDGWVVNQKLDMTLSSRTGENIQRRNTQASWEAKDGSKFRFKSRHTEQGLETEAFEGEAKRYFLDAEAKYTEPKGVGTVRLPRGVMFPTAHTVKMLDSAGTKPQFFTARMFDGNDETGQMDLTAAISALGQPASAVGDTLVTNSLLQGEVVKTRVAFFDVGQIEAEPQYEMILELQKNGVARSMTVDYGDFAMRASLKNIEQTPVSGCQ